MSAPDRTDIEKALRRLGWTWLRTAKAGELWESPSGADRLLLARPGASGGNYRRVRNDLARLKHGGEDAQALYAELRPAKADLHLPKINPTEPPPPIEAHSAVDIVAEPTLGNFLALDRETASLDPTQVDLVASATTRAVIAEGNARQRQQAARIQRLRSEQLERHRAAEQAAAEKARESDVTPKDYKTQSARERAALELVNHLLVHHGGELDVTDAASSGAHSASAVLTGEMRRSGHFIVDFAHKAVELGWLEMIRPGRNIKGMRVTPAGRTKVDTAPVEPRQPQAEQDRSDWMMETELGMLLGVAEEERDKALAEVEALRAELAEAERRRDDWEATARDMEQRAEDMMRHRDVLQARVRELEQRLAEPAASHTWVHPMLGTAVDLLTQADAMGSTEVREALLAAVRTVLERAQ